MGSKHKLVVVLSGFCIVYLVGAAWLCARLGLLQHLDTVIFSTRDSRSYLQVMEYIVGESKVVPTQALALRPVLFPAYLCLYHVSGPWVFLGAQWACNVGSIIFVFVTVWRLTKSLAASLAAVGLLASNLTFTLIALHGLSETLAILLVASMIYCMAGYAMRHRASTLYSGLLLAAAGTCVRPALLPCVLVWSIVAAVHVGKAVLYRESSRWNRAVRRAMAWLAGLSPIIAQLVFSYVVLGTVSLSTAGRVNLDERFFPAVYGFAKWGEFVSYRDPRAAEARVQCPDLPAKVRFLLGHLVRIFQTVRHIAFMNITDGSACLLAPRKAFTDQGLAGSLYKLTVRINQGCWWMHWVFAGGLVCLVLCRAGDGSNVFYISSGLMLYALLATSALTYWQGDRIVVSAMPIWCVLYPACGCALARDLSRRVGRQDAARDASEAASSVSAAGEPCEKVPKPLAERACDL